LDDAKYHGHAGVRAMHHDVFEVVGAYTAEPEQIEDLGEHVLVRVRVRVSGKHSAVPIDRWTIWVRLFWRDAHTG
jgi:hypothetical protein